jgi:cation:H+ antiporter
MQYLEPILYLLGGFAILIVGGESLVKAAISLAARLKVSPTVIGLTIIAAGTSAPELMTSLLAAYQEAPDIAVGNVVGSNIFNILVILGIAALIKVNVVDKSIALVELPSLIVFSLLMYFLLSDGFLSRTDGIILIAVLIGYLISSISRARKNPASAEDMEDMTVLESLKWDIGHLVIGCLALTGGAHLALEGGISIGKLIGLSDRIIGITIISVGTGLPELATSAVAAFKGRNDIAIANVIGSNIMNTLAILGLTASIHPIVVSEQIATRDIFFMIAATVILLPLIYLNKYRIGKSSGVILIGTYVAYVTYILTT